MNDNHLLPYYDRGWIVFPAWMCSTLWPFDLGWRLGAWIGETFNDGCYAFTVKQ